jgi:hypothetical protein
MQLSSSYDLARKRLNLEQMVTKCLQDGPTTILSIYTPCFVSVEICIVLLLLVNLDQKCLH